MYSLVSTCIRPNIHDEAEEIFVSTPALVAGGDGCSKGNHGEANKKDTPRRRQQQHQYHPSDKRMVISMSATKTAMTDAGLVRLSENGVDDKGKEILSGDANVKENVNAKVLSTSSVCADTPPKSASTSTVKVPSASHSKPQKRPSPSALSLASSTTTTASQNAIPSIEVLHNSQSSLPECIVVQSPSRSRKRDAIATSSISGVGHEFMVNGSINANVINNNNNDNHFDLQNHDNDNDPIHGPQTVIPMGFAVKREIPLIYSPLYVGERDGENHNGANSNSVVVGDNDHNHITTANLFPTGSSMKKNRKTKFMKQGKKNLRKANASATSSSSLLPATVSSKAQDREALVHPIYKQNTTHNDSKIIQPNPPNLKDFAQRWNYQSSLAGDHSQNSHVLDISHLTNISLLSLKYGLTPNMANGIREFKCSMNNIHTNTSTCTRTVPMDGGLNCNNAVNNDYDLPRFLDLVITLFPNLESFTLVEKKDNDDSNYHCGASPEAVPIAMNSTCSNTSTTTPTHQYQQQQQQRQHLNGNDDDFNSNANARIKIYSADGDDQEVDDIYELATKSMKKLPFVSESTSATTLSGNDLCNNGDDETLLHPPKICSSMISSKALQMAKRESERMRRLYILYRLPDLISINGKLVTEEERSLARPMSPSGHKVNRQEWLTQAMAVKDCVAGKGTSCSRSNEGKTKLFGEHNGQYFSSDECVNCGFQSQETEKHVGHEVTIGTSEKETKNISANLSTHDDTNSITMGSVENVPPLTLPFEMEAASSSSTILKDNSSHDSTSSQEQTQQPQQPASVKGLPAASPSRSNLIGIFPHTGKSVSMKDISNPTKQASPINARLKKQHSIPLQKQSMIEDDSNALNSMTLKRNQPPSKSNTNTNTPTTIPHKTNLDSFIAKDKARGFPSDPQLLPPPSEATDIAIAGHLLSKCSLDPPHTEKENTVNANFASDYHQGEHLPSTDKKGLRKRNNSIRRRDRKDRRSMPLVGSMVKVKLKKGKRKQSRPPTSPASTLREFPTPRKSKKNPPLASVIDQMDDDDDDEDDDMEMGDEAVFLNQEASDP